MKNNFSKKQKNLIFKFVDRKIIEINDSSRKNNKNISVVLIPLLVDPTTYYIAECAEIELSSKYATVKKSLNTVELKFHIPWKNVALIITDGADTTQKDTMT